MFVLVSSFLCEHTAEADFSEELASLPLCVFLSFFFASISSRRRKKKYVKGVTTPASSAVGVKYDRWRTSGELHKSKHTALTENKTSAFRC